MVRPARESVKPSAMKRRRTHRSYWPAQASQRRPSKLEGRLEVDASLPVCLPASRYVFCLRMNSSRQMRMSRHSQLCNQRCLCCRVHPAGS